MRSEDLGVIVADKGMVDDHMPTHVMDTLRAYHKYASTETSTSGRFTRERVENLRDKELMTTIRNKIEQREIELEGPYDLRADSMGWDEVDGEEETQVNRTLEAEGEEQGMDTAVDIEGNRPVHDGSWREEPLAEDMVDDGETAESLAGHGEGGEGSDLTDGARALAGDPTEAENVLVVERYDQNEYFELHSVGTTL